ncbi:glycosyl hydrolase family 26 [Celerinatantimonas sp. MCCC 1A17872]|uniref:glycosyl hydrolase family 26 n=1 Tax=Celerinatantimonas sp. MCCC 1A17872 TaxID=3177514 RepID=UPI0038C8637D
MKYRLGALLGVILLIGCQSSAVNVSTSDIAIPTEKPTFIYLVHMNSHHMICGNMINQMPQLDNTTSVTGDIIAGFNVTAFLQLGENSLGSWVASINGYSSNGGDGSIQRNDGDCQMILTANTEQGNKVELTSLHITVDAGKATAEMSKTYPAKHRTDISQLKVSHEGWESEYHRPFYIKTIPQWAWTKAEPFKPTRENMKKLHRAYQALIEMMKRKDYQGLKDAYSLSSREKSLAEAGQSSPDEFFDAIGFKDDLTEKGAVVESPKDWSNYEVKSYLDGKLVQLEDEDGYSPLRVKNSEGVVTTYKPYFSIINGRVVISR